MYNTADIASATETAEVRVGRDFSGTHVLLHIPRDGGKGTCFLFTPEEATGIIREMERQLRIIRGMDGGK